MGKEEPSRGSALLRVLPPLYPCPPILDAFRTQIFTQEGEEKEDGPPNRPGV